MAFGFDRVEWLRPHIRSYKEVGRNELLSLGHNCSRSLFQLIQKSKSLNAINCFAVHPIFPK